MKVTYIKTKLSNVINISKIVTIHYYEFDKSFVFKGEKHDFWELVFVDRGEVLISSDGKETVLKQDEVIFHKPNEFHSIRAHNSAPNVFIISFVCNSLAMHYFKGLKTMVNKRLKMFISSIIEEARNTFDLPVNNPNLKQLILKDNGEIGGEQLIKTYLEQFLIMLIRFLTNKKETKIFPSKETMENHLVSSIIRIIEDNIYGAITVSDICRKLGYSRTYLSELFRQQSGYTISNYYTISKINLAKQLIREDNYNFTQISDLLKFDNPQYFSRVFKRITKMSPSEYKNSVII